MKTRRLHWLSGGAIWIANLAGSASVQGQEAVQPPGESGGSVPTVIAATNADWQAVLDQAMESSREADHGQRDPHSIKVLGEQLDTLLGRGEAARAANQPAAYYAAWWGLLQLMPAVAEKTPAAREKIAATSARVKAFLADFSSPLDAMSDSYRRYREPLGMRSAAVDRFVRQMGVTGRVDCGKGRPGEGAITWPADGATAAAEPITFDRVQLDKLEKALANMRRVNTKTISRDFDAHWSVAAKAASGGWAFQILYRQDAKIAQTHPETLRLLQSLNHGLGDLARYEGLLPPLEPGSDGPDAGAAVQGSATELIADGSAVRGSAAGVKGAPIAARAGTNPADWLAKLDAQLKQAAELKKIAEANKKTPFIAERALTEKNLALAGNIQKAARDLVNVRKAIQQRERELAEKEKAGVPAKTDKPEKVEKQDPPDKAKAEDSTVTDYFAAQWRLLRLLPETAYLTPTTRQALAGSNTETQAYLKEHADATKALSTLFVRFKQRLGLWAPKVILESNPKAVPGEVNQTQNVPQADSNGEIVLKSGDLLSATKAAETVTPAEQNRIRELEKYLIQIRVDENKKDIIRADQDFKKAADYLDGGYFFQVLYKAEPKTGKDYPNVLEFLGSLYGHSQNPAKGSSGEGPGLEQKEAGDVEAPNDGIPNPPPAGPPGLDPEPAGPIFRTPPASNPPNQGNPVGATEPTNAVSPGLNQNTPPSPQTPPTTGLTGGPDYPSSPTVNRGGAGQNNGGGTTSPSSQTPQTPSQPPANNAGGNGKSNGGGGTTTPGPQTPSAPPTNNAGGNGNSNGGGGTTSPGPQKPSAPPANSNAGGNGKSNGGGGTTSPAPQTPSAPPASNAGGNGKSNGGGGTASPASPKPSGPPANSNPGGNGKSNGGGGTASPAPQKPSTPPANSNAGDNGKSNGGGQGNAKSAPPPAGSATPPAQSKGHGGGSHKGGGNKGP